MKFWRLINTHLLKYTVLRLVRDRQFFQQIASKQWTLCPPEAYNTPKAVYLEDTLDRVTGVYRTQTFERQKQLVEGGIREQAATAAYLLKDVSLYNGRLYKGTMREVFVNFKDTLWGCGEMKHYSEAALASTFCGSLYFGDWMTNDLSLALAAQQFSQALMVERQWTPHQQDYLRLFNIPVEFVRQAYCRNFVLIDDIGQTQYKRDRYELMRSQLKLLAPPQDVPGVMFLRKGSGKARILTNEAQVAAYLESSRGFRILDVETMTAEEIVRQTRGARVIIGVEGSQLMHGLFSMQDNGIIFTLQPPYRFNNIYKEYTDCLGMTYAFVIGKQVEGGFEIEMDELDKTLERVERVVKS